MRDRDQLRAEQKADLQIRRAVAIHIQKVADRAKLEADELVQVMQETRRDGSNRGSSR